MAQITYIGKTGEKYTAQAVTGDSILELAITHDVPLQHACGGFCACTTCHVKVVQGMENLTQMEEDERERIDSTAEEIEPRSRLGCQARLNGNGDVVVEMVNTD